jgi:hypothetical protein
LVSGAGLDVKKYPTCSNTYPLAAILPSFQKRILPKLTFGKILKKSININY